MDNVNVMYSDGSYDVSGKYKVRVHHENGVAYFSMTDVLTVCGVKYPSKWVYDQKQRYGREYDSTKISVMAYPKNQGGRQKKLIRFVTAEQARTVMKFSPASENEKKWLEELFVIECGKEPKIEIKANKIDKPVEESKTTELGLDEILDRILFDLVELKKLIKNA